MNKSIMSPHWDFIIYKNTVLCADITLQQQKGFAVAVIVNFEQEEDVTEENKEEYGMIKSNLILEELKIDG